MFHQLVSPIAGSLPLSFVVATIPIAVVLVLLGVLRRPKPRGEAPILVRRCGGRIGPFLPHAERAERRVPHCH